MIAYGWVYKFAFAMRIKAVWETMSVLHETECAQNIELFIKTIRFCIVRTKILNKINQRIESSSQVIRKTEGHKKRF